MSLIRPDDDPQDVIVAIILVVIAILALIFIPHPLWVHVQ